jgi:hypothetical protein
MINYKFTIDWCSDINAENEHEALNSLMEIIKNNLVCKIDNNSILCTLKCSYEDDCENEY